MKYIAYVLWGGAICAYYMQPFCRDLAIAIVPMLSFFLFYCFIKYGFIFNYNIALLMLFFCIWLSVSAVYSSLDYNCDYSNIIRFVLILIAIPLAQNVNWGKFQTEYNIFIIISCIKSILIVCIFSVVFQSQDYSNWREWAKLSEAGDVYILNGIPRVQLHGNALLVVAFMIDYALRKRFNTINIILLAGCLAAGNVAFISIVIIFLCMMWWPIFAKQIKGRNWSLVISFPLCIFALIAFFYYLTFNFEQKSELSNVIRKEQMEILLDSLFLIGHGIGALVTETGYFRDYTGNIYFELQPLYIVFQIGVIGLIVFYIITIYSYINKKVALMVYALYLLFSGVNPYCFDSTHVIAVILISGVLLRKSSCKMVVEK